MESSKDPLNYKAITNIITKINLIINENRKYFESTIKEINKQFNKIEELTINSNIKLYKEIKSDIGLYFGQVVDGLAEGKGTYYYNNGDRFEGKWKKNKREGRGIFYYNNGDRYEGDFKNDIREGKGIIYKNNGYIY